MRDSIESESIQDREAFRPEPIAPRSEADRPSRRLASLPVRTHPSTRRVALAKRAWNNRAVTSEAPLVPAGSGLAPEGDGWFVVNARDARWREGHFGGFTNFEGEAHFPQLGINIGVLEPGQPACMYHGESNQENFLVLSGECLLLIEGQERPLKAWDFVHCPPWTEHVFVGAGAGPCAILAVGGRSGKDVIYPVNELALGHGAGVEAETRAPDEAYASFRPDVDAEYREDWLPG
jgi:mannose-6-phosphate isomerase-like protein (cupin superfamily)